MEKGTNAARRVPTRVPGDSPEAKPAEGGVWQEERARPSRKARSLADSPPPAGGEQRRRRPQGAEPRPEAPRARPSEPKAPEVRARSPARGAGGPELRYSLAPSGEPRPAPTLIHEAKSGLPPPEPPPGPAEGETGRAASEGPSGPASRREEPKAARPEAKPKAFFGRWRDDQGPPFRPARPPRSPARGSPKGPGVLGQSPRASPPGSPGLAPARPPSARAAHEGPGSKGAEPPCEPPSGCPIPAASPAPPGSQRAPPGGPSEPKGNRKGLVPRSSAEAAPLLPELSFAGPEPAAPAGEPGSAIFKKMALGGPRPPTRVSLGILLCRVSGATGRPEVLLVHKRYTYAFAEFVHGRYARGRAGSSTALRSAAALVDHMTTEELLDVWSLNFEQMWFRIWLSRDKRDLYNKKHAKFQSTFMRDDGGKALKRTVEQARTRGALLWEVPKGRRLSPREADVLCAVRELREETGVDKSKYRILPGVKRRVSYVSAGTRYTCAYYIALANQPRALPAGGASGSGPSLAPPPGFDPRSEFGPEAPPEEPWSSGERAPDPGPWAAPRGRRGGLGAAGAASSPSLGGPGRPALREIRHMGEVSEVSWYDIERVRLLDGPEKRLESLVKPAFRLVKRYLKGRWAFRRDDSPAPTLWAPPGAARGPAPERARPAPDGTARTARQERDFGLCSATEGAGMGPAPSRPSPEPGPPRGGPRPSQPPGEAWPRASETDIGPAAPRAEIDGGGWLRPKWSRACQRPRPPAHAGYGHPPRASSFAVAGGKAESAWTQGPARQGASGPRASFAEAPTGSGTWPHAAPAARARPGALAGAQRPAPGSPPLARSAARPAPGSPPLARSAEEPEPPRKRAALGRSSSGWAPSGSGWAPGGRDRASGGSGPSFGGPRQG
jgi:ADP-ribose pyrophosphatase YjhB (NUDIX family)